MTAENILRVPIRVDGLYVDAETLNLGLPMADFSQLPYHVSHGSTDSTINPGTANLAQVAFNKALGRADGVGGGLPFPKGLHLHWALPDALTTGHHRGNSTTFPPVPNRWLVRRLDHTGTLQKSWIVESDFLHPLDNTGLPIVDPATGVTAWPNNKPITFPAKRHQTANGNAGAAFRYMGRSMFLSDWLKRNETTDEFLNQDAHSHYKLTALGYGEPAFAAYYPNCYSVFGFCDVDPDPATSYEYQVIGWFNEANLDPLQSAEFAGLHTDAERYGALEQEYRWFVNKDDTQKAFPKLIVCYASLTVTPNAVKRWTSTGTVDLAIGNTGGESLSALLADACATQAADKPTIEDQLEAINISASLQGVEVDYKAHFAQTRHQRGFRGVAGGSRWAVLPRDSQQNTAARAAEQNATQPPLPDRVAHALDALNDAQEAYDMAQQEIVELRYQTFCDWHKFLEAVNSNTETLAPFRLQSNNLSIFIQSQDVGLFIEKVEKAGKLVLKEKTATAVGPKQTTTLILATNALEPKNPANDNFAVQVILRLRTLINTLFDAQVSDKFEIVNHAAEHFWRPNEPVVLLAGPVAVSTARHGEDGDLSCAVVNVPDAPGTDAFINAVASLKPSGSDPAIQTQSESPWHPIILEWNVSVQPLQTARIANFLTNGSFDYGAAFITESFPLSENHPDFDSPTNLSLFNANAYDGRCLITPTAGTQLETNLRTYLLKVTLDDCRDRAAIDEPDYVNRLIRWFETKHNVIVPTKDSEKAAWLKQQRPFVADKKDADGNSVLLPVDELFAFYPDKPVNGENNTVGNWSDTQKAEDPIYSAIRALHELQGKSVLSQALGGFNAALMTRQQVLQIPIEDPLNADTDLTTAVAAAVGPRHPMAPIPGIVFNPIRSGTLSLNGLRLMDTFGQQWNAPLKGVVTSNSLSLPNDPKLIYLPPRVSAPTRLNFRWLAALSGQNGVDEVEMNSSPATTPVCGWLLPNNFDSSVMVYDNTGRALGSINSMAEWVPAPGCNHRIGAGEIPNPHLRRLVRRLIVALTMSPVDVKIRQQFLQSFLSVLDSSLEAIEPASFAQHEALALLMGRPIAIVRARVDLQLMGQTMDWGKVADPTIPGGEELRLKKSSLWQAFTNQDWNVFAYDWGHYYNCSYLDIENQSCSFLDSVSNYSRTTNGFEKVVMPVRLGEHQLLNDGLVGFWEETGDELDNVFHAPQTLDDVDISDDVLYKAGLTTPCIRPHAGKQSDNLRLTLEDEPRALTILMDPRGVIHATSGILPVSQVQIPPVYYADALKSMGVTFRVSPLLTDAEELHAAVPKEPGYKWSWVTKANADTWEETATIADATEQAHFFKPPKIVEGWLKLTPDDKE